MTKLISFLIIIIGIYSCNFSSNNSHIGSSSNNNTQKKKNTEFKNVKRISVDSVHGSYTLVHTIYNDDGTVGYVYVDKLDDKTFSKLKIIKKNKQKTEVLYRIEKNKFMNTEELDIEVFDDKCYEYDFVQMGKDYIIVEKVCRETSTVSDPITISWDKSSKIYKVEKGP